MILPDKKWHNHHWEFWVFSLQWELYSTLWQSPWHWNVANKYKVFTKLGLTSWPQLEVWMASQFWLDICRFFYLHSSFCFQQYLPEINIVKLKEFWREKSCSYICFVFLFFFPSISGVSQLHSLIPSLFSSLDVFGILNTLQCQCSVNRKQSYCCHVELIELLQIKIVICCTKQHWQTNS